ncbi:gas vesicle accessory protein GvpU (plasmid) [Staphylococcus equorum]|jgi:hypothetical protein
MSEVSSKDDILEAFVEVANKDGFTLDISLLVNGAIVSGTLVSAKDYFKSLSKSFKKGNDVAQELSKELANASDSADSNDAEVQYIHLKDTRIYLGDSKSTPSTGETLWRGKLNEVDSFFLGKITESK